MTKLRGIELPDGITEAFKQSILHARDSVLQKAASNADARLLRGIRPNQQNIGKIRSRLITSLENESVITSNHFAVLSATRPLPFLKDSSVQTLDNQLDTLCLVYGRDKTLASLLMDERENVWVLARDVISGEREVKALSEDAQEDFTSIFKPFFAKQGDEPVSASATAPAQEKHLVDELKRHNASLEEQVNRLTQQQKKLKEERKEYKDRAAKCNKALASAELAARDSHRLQARITQLSQSLAASEAELRKLYSDIATMVEGKVHSVVHSWIRRPEELEKASRAIADSASPDAAARAEAIISKQQEIDRHQGNRQRLRTRLEHLKKLHGQLEDLAIESINPLKELNASRQDLTREINRLQQQLGLTTHHSNFVKSIMARIGTISHPDELLSHKSLLEALNGSGVLTTVEMRAIYAYYHERITLCYEKYPPDTDDPDALIDTLYRLKRALTDNTAMDWLIDGHNVLFRFQDLFGTLDQDGKHTESSRRKLSELLVQLTRTAQECQVKLFFDGPEYSRGKVATNVEVIYSGGEGDHRADKAVCDMLEYRRYQSIETPALLTSDDQDLRNRAKQLGSHLMNTDEFFALAQAFGKLPDPAEPE